jgi:hypothetical protein
MNWKYWKGAVAVCFEVRNLHLRAGTEKSDNKSAVYLPLSRNSNQKSTKYEAGVRNVGSRYRIAARECSQDCPCIIRIVNSSEVTSSWSTRRVQDDTASDQLCCQVSS